MVVLENHTISNLTKNDALVKEFPFLRTAKNLIARSSIGCGACSGTKPAGPDFNNIKMFIAGLPEVSKRRLKELTGWDSVKIMYWTGTGMKTVII